MLSEDVWMRLHGPMWWSEVNGVMVWRSLPGGRGLLGRGLETSNERSGALPSWAKRVCKPCPWSLGSALQMKPQNWHGPCGRGRCWMDA